jgi:curli biogenesis system outer membrane secretion channel CsgG
MKSICMGKITAVGVTVLSLAGCLATGGVTSQSGPAMDSVRLEKYDGPKARIAIAEFEDKAGGGYHHEYGVGMKDMLTTALFQSNRYIVLERERMAALEAERARRGSKGKIEDADLLVTAAITGFDPGESGMAAGVGGLFGRSSAISSLTGSFKQARVAMDIRVIDVDTGRIIAATSAEGKATSVGAGVAGYGGPMGGSLKGFQKGPMEGAIREMIKASVDFIISNTPSRYYRDNK